MKLFASCVLVLLCLTHSVSLTLAVPVEEVAAQVSVKIPAATAASSASGAAFQLQVPSLQTKTSNVAVPAAAAFQLPKVQSGHIDASIPAAATASSSAAGELFSNNEAVDLQSEDGSSVTNEPVTWNGWKWFPTRFSGTATNGNILAACRAQGLQTPCDHPSYNDGNCVTAFAGGHMSYNPHHGDFTGPPSNKFFYCGAANGQQSLYNTAGSHRWSDGNDRDGMTLCVQEASEDPVTWNGWTFVPTKIEGQRTSANILAACKKAGLETPCDNPAYSDSKCVTVWSGHLSNTPEHSSFTLTNNKYFYAGTQQNGMSLGSTVSSHRWATADNQGGMTLCVKTNPKMTGIQTWNGWTWVPVKFNGAPNSANILAACRAEKLQTPCDHPSYNDGNCITAWAGGHLSTTSGHSFTLANNKFFYCGAANGDKSLHNTGTSHRWSDGNDREGTTLCVQWNEKSQEETKWNGWTFVPTNIQGQRTSANILEACNAARLETPCDNPGYSDGKCVTVFANHLSVTPQHADFTLTDNKYFYAGTQQNGFSLGSTVASHRWATADNQNGQTLCVTGNEKAQNPQNWNGWWWIPTEVKGYPNSANILAACTALGYQTPCDHPSYNDGKCTVGFSGGHMSYIGHNGFQLANNKFFYCGGANGVESLHNTGASHRWSVSTDRDVRTLCLSKNEPKDWAGQRRAPPYVPLSQEFAIMVKKIKAGLEAILTFAQEDCARITKKRDAAKIIFDSKLDTAVAAEKTFNTAFNVRNVEDASCTRNTAEATATLATRNAANSDLSSRNPVIQKELDVLDRLFGLIDQLKAINLQETVDVDAHTSATQDLHDTVVMLQSMNDEAGPLAEMVELAREHAEFTKPILDLLNQLKSKLLKERDQVTTAATAATNAYNVAAEAAAKSCASRDGKIAELNSAKSNLAAATAGKEAAENQYKTLQAIWVVETGKCDAVQKKVDDENAALKRLEQCSLSAPKPFKSCYEILADNAKAASGEYKIDPSGSGTANQAVYCDMTTNGGGWTLLSSHDAAGGYFDTKTALSTGSVNADGSTALYSILGMVDAFKRDGKFEFRYNTKATKTGPVDTWVTASQTSSPLDTSRVGGCAADWKVVTSNYAVGSEQKLFCGWTPGPSGWAAINGYGPNWTHAIGQFKVYSDWPLVCTYNTNYFCSKVQFWVR